MPERRQIRRLFVANRGEIAVRIARAAKKLGIESVVGVSAAAIEKLRHVVETGDHDGNGNFVERKRHTFLTPDC